MEERSAGEIRAMVRKHYGGLAAPAHGIACCPGRGADRGTALLAGYDGDELERIARITPVSSHGCGHPAALAGLERGEAVLDLGSGSGLDLLLAAQRTGAEGRVTGVDMTPAMVDRARKAAAATGAKNVEVREGIIEELPVETGSVDQVISNCALSLSPEKSRVLAETVRVLRPGGKATISDVVVSGLPVWVRENGNLYGSCIGGALEEDECLRALGEAGLEEVRVLEKRLFDQLQLEIFLLVGTTGSGLQDPCSCGGYLAGRLLGRTAELLAGKVGSLTVAARAPA